MSKKAGAAFVGMLASPLLFLVFLFAFPATWVGLARCSGAQQDLETHDGKVLLAEIANFHAEESDVYRVLRVQLLDAKTGKPTAGPWLFDGYDWLGAAGAVGWYAKPQLTAFSLVDGKGVADPKLLGAKHSALAGHLRAGEQASFIDDQGRLVTATDDGRKWALDALLQAVEVDDSPRHRSRPSATRSSIDRMRWEGAGRKHLSSGTAAASFLGPEFLNDTTNDQPLGFNGAWLVVHYDHLDHDSHRRGMMLSLIDASAAERWRWLSKRDDADATERVIGATVLDGVLVVQTVTNDRALFGIDVATGKLLWKRD